MDTHFANMRSLIQVCYRKQFFPDVNLIKAGTNMRSLIQILFQKAVLSWCQFDKRKNNNRNIVYCLAPGG